MFVAGDVVRHRKTGGLYEIVCAAKLEATLEAVIVYRSQETGQMWVRPEEQMFDGRFEQV